MSEKIRPLEERDREAIAQIVSAVGNFNTNEIEIAMELIDESLGGDRDYQVVVLEDAGEIRGYSCFGPTPLTEGTFDLYWIAVDPGAQGHGYGAKLLHFVEEQIRNGGGRLLIIETSSQEAYGGTIRFYENNQYELTARIPDFYHPGDDKLIFTKNLT